MLTANKSITLCRDNCCPTARLSDAGNKLILSADRKTDEVNVTESTVEITLNTVAIERIISLSFFLKNKG